MASSVSVAFLWHFHQPYYRNDVTGEVALPWARLHGVKDYTGMALLLRRFPGVRATINFVPSLLRQLEETDHLFEHDPWLRLSAKPAADLDEAERAFLLREFFWGPPATMIAPHRRYAELLALRGGPDHLGAERHVRRFTEADLRDTQVWANLAWFHPLLIEDDTFLAGLVKKERGYTEEEKTRLLHAQVARLPRVVELYRELQDRGQIELTVTPYYHPILPLLLDWSCVRDAHPHAPLAPGWEPLEDDAVSQTERALAAFERRFGRRPRGVWPAEGAVSEAAAALLVRAGARWFATDEGVLARSLGVAIERNAAGALKNPDLLYQAYKLATPAGEAALFFRDHRLSDLIGFSYRDRPPREAAEHFLSVARDARARSARKAPILPVILDGENAWEYYPGGGVPFLTALYAALEGAGDEVRTARLSDALDAAPAETTLPRLAAGSWINADLRIWAGHAEDRAAWALLFAARRRLVERAASGSLPAAAEARAREEIAIAEGSDWFWWFGDEHSTAHDADFDRLFRAHLQNVYTLCGDDPPAPLREPIKRRKKNAPAGEAPTGAMAPPLDGSGSGRRASP
ncbi:MAG: alpha-amylase/alpha-mannosidase [Planctomycetes bacterium]|nr:alpha-amylase/alpha-mannosidase [Planctomycetota bacterium]